MNERVIFFEGARIEPPKRSNAILNEGAYRTGLNRVPTRVLKLGQNSYGQILVQLRSEYEAPIHPEYCAKSTLLEEYTLSDTGQYIISIKGRDTGETSTAIKVPYNSDGHCSKLLACCWDFCMIAILFMI